MYQPKPGASKYVTALFARRKFQLNMLGEKRTFKSIARLNWLTVIVKYRKAEYFIYKLFHR